MELLIVVAVLGIVSAAAAPLFSSLAGGSANAMSMAGQGVLTNARQFALAHGTYVRVGFAQIFDKNKASVVIQSLASMSGDLRADSSNAMGDRAQWRMIDRPVVLPGATLDNGLLSRLPGGASAVQTPGSRFPAFTCRGPGGVNISYSQILQFDPSGQASISADSLAHCIGVGLSNPRQPRDSVVILLSGLTGNVQAMREENFTRQ